MKVIKVKSKTKGRRDYLCAPKDIDWKKSRPDIEEMIRRGSTLEFIGRQYGVSRQRIYQVIQDLHINVRSAKEDIK